MNGALSGDQFLFDGPAAYRIVVRGRVTRDFAERLEGLEIEQTVGQDGADISVLRGALADQTALTSVLVLLHELQMVVLLVEQASSAGLEDSNLAPINPHASSGTEGSSPDAE